MMGAGVTEAAKVLALQLVSKYNVEVQVIALEDEHSRKSIDLWPRIKCHLLLHVSG